LLGFGVLIEQQLVDNEFFKLSDIAHHEVMAVCLWCMGIGILIGVLAMKYTALLIPGNALTCPTCAQQLLYEPRG
jgi:hypothetical protein